MLRAKRSKPIALISDSNETALSWAMRNLKVREYTKSNREILASGRRFIICTQPEHLLGMEISDYKDVGGNTKPASFFINMIKMAQTRMR